MKKYIPSLFLGIALILLCSGAAAAETKIVYMDSQRILTDSLAGKDVYSKLQVIKDEKQTEIDKMQESLQALGNDISIKSPTMKVSARQELELKYEQELRKYNRFVKDAQEELRRMELTLVKPISEEVNTIIEDYGNKNDIDIILDRRDPGIIYTSKELDITDDILELYDKKYKESKGKKE